MICIYETLLDNMLYSVQDRVPLLQRSGSPSRTYQYDLATYTIGITILMLAMLPSSS